MLLVWRHNSNGLANSMPCGLCVHRTLPRYAKILKIQPNQMKIYYSVVGGMYKTNLQELMENKIQYITKGTRLNL